jgi:hypothetical protein
MLKDQWEGGETPRREPRPPAAAPILLSGVVMGEITVIVHGSTLVGIGVGDDEPISTFARSRDAEHKWIDALALGMAVRYGPATR